MFGKKTVSLSLTADVAVGELRRSEKAGVGLGAVIVGR